MRKTKAELGHYVTIDKKIGYLRMCNYCKNLYVQEFIHEALGIESKCRCRTEIGTMD